jgi:TonB family protein
VTQGSSLPPIRKNDGKYLLVALLLLLAAGVLWFFLRSEDSQPPPEAVEPAPEPPIREQFVPQIEIPEDQSQAKQVEPEEPKPREPTWKPPSEWDCRGTLQVAQIREVINGQPRKQVQTCYERGLKGNNLLQGTMKVLLTIGSNGEVSAVSIRGSLDDPQVYTCVRRVAKTWKFPKPEGGCVRIEVPFQLTPKL